MGKKSDRYLARLIEEQESEIARESRTSKLPRHRGEVRFSELPEPERLNAEGGGRHYRTRHQQPRQWAVYLYGCDPHQWDACRQMQSLLIYDPHDRRAARHIKHYFEHVATPIRCPVCMERPLPIGWYCLACDRAGLDPFDENPSNRFNYKGIDVDLLPEWGYIRESKLDAGDIKEEEQED